MPAGPDTPQMAEQRAAQKAAYDAALARGLTEAQAREDVEAGRPLSSSQLAMLASLSPRAVQALVASEEIKAGKDGVPAKEARRWLAARGVPGFGKKSSR